MTLGSSLLAPLKQLARWAEENAAAITAREQAYDRAASARVP